MLNALKTKFARNDGAMSLEYILVIVVVVLVALIAMKAFGGQVGNTINDSKNAIANATNGILSQNYVA